MADPSPAYLRGSMRAARAADYLDVSETFFREHIAPALSPIRLSKGVILYRRADLDSWLDRQAGGPAASVAPRNPWHPVG